MKSLFRQTSSSGAEVAIHASLGLAAIVAIVTAISAIGEFNVQRTNIAAALSPNSDSGVASSERHGREPATTNLSRVAVDTPSPENIPTNPPTTARAPALPTG